MSKEQRFDKHLVSLTAPGSFAAEQYQGLRLTVERLARSRQMQVLAVTSPAAADGKTVTSINLAGALARGSDAKVLLIDADLRRPSVDKQLGLGDSGLGLFDALSDEKCDLARVTRKLDGISLSVVPAGTTRSAIHNVLRIQRVEALLREARQQYDYIVLDTPPLLPVFDSAMLAKAVDGVLMVLSANRTPRKLLGEALNLLEPDKVIGIVFNRDERPLFGYYDAYYSKYFSDAESVPSGA